MDAYTAMRLAIATAKVLNAINVIRQQVQTLMQIIQTVRSFEGIMRGGAWIGGNAEDFIQMANATITPGLDENAQRLTRIAQGVQEAMNTVVQADNKAAQVAQELNTVFRF